MTDPAATTATLATRAGQLTGGCSCGQVRFQVRARADRCYACHCTECQTRTGSAFALLLPVSETFFKVEGDLLAVAQEEAGGVKAKLYACPRCLTRLFTRNPLWPGLAILRAGALDDTAGVAPAFHIWTRSRQPWVCLTDGRPTFETQPTDPAEWRRLLG
jgi:hypothetical protein